MISFACNMYCPEYSDIPLIEVLFPAAISLLAFLIWLQPILYIKKNYPKYTLLWFVLFGYFINILIYIYLLPPYIYYDGMSCSCSEGGGYNYALRESVYGVVGFISVIYIYIIGPVVSIKLASRLYKKQTSKISK
jgi:hypothetical protein